ncbi:MAG: Gfo/Idh/MocA family oxidoreductase [Planctomycetia bacterium]|nr:Gfo/Idh/MocA family oxidoreductase [Planctomycetia bacterium]
MKTNLSRRYFLAAGAVLGGIPTFLPNLLHGEEAPSERLRFAHIGLGGMGCADVQGHRHLAELVGLCDVDAQRLQSAAKQFQTPSELCYADYRRILDRDDVDVVSCSTPDHWHVKICIEALQAGKHVFCQKPLTLTVEEGFLIRKACEKYRKTFQVGTQQRDDTQRFLRAVNMAHKGILGKIHTVTVGLPTSPRSRDICGPFEPSPVPEELDWNTWLGQAPWTEYIRQRCHGTFRYWFEYASGVIADWGAHHVDIALWLLREDKKGCGPLSVDGTESVCAVDFHDGIPSSDRYYNTPIDFRFVCPFASGATLIITNKADNGLLVEGEKGRIFVNRERITGQPIEEAWDQDQYTEEDKRRLFKGKNPSWHKANFYQCIREGGLTVSDPFSHVQAMTVCHLCGIAARLKRKFIWDPVAETIVGDDLAKSFLQRPQRKGFEIHV